MNSCVINSVMLSQRGRMLYVIGGFKFRFQKSLVDGTERWSCCKDGCRCFIKVNKKREVIESFTDHNHDKNSEHLLSRQKLSNVLKRKAVGNPQEQATKLVRKEMMNINEPMTSYDALLIKNNIYYARASQMQRKILKDYYAKGSSETSKGKIGSAGENRRTLASIKQGFLFQPLCEGRQREANGIIRNDKECELSETTVENNVITSQNFSPFPAENVQREPIDQQMLLQPVSETAPNASEALKGDPDMHFLLSLLPHFKSIPEHLKFEAHFDIMGVIKKYKTADYTQSSYHPQQYNSVPCNFIDPTQQNNPSSHTNPSQSSTYCKMQIKEEYVDSTAELLSSEAVESEDVKFQKPDD